ncbi:YbaB/EbfC family nucleoid-associated protein [Flavicella sp.]|uniref:YbaB/EbfC family nucleoid-associated protein n=1 Tax=Flavicella sp. TaxID=2957742 RepID=UPI002637E6AC|nr:YbaB/EbfC family nucleoid-associated protein [Flavicella sp.]MDG1805319.1 YbaB/EbfC family nucleoid-associated protein [Flavicella sp.]MDG2280156.1 YbaB/EbfC family nucleoid-associated protein [Flavicella sp.]
MVKDAESLLNELKQTQVEIVAKKEHLRTVFIDGESGNGLVVATITANKQIVNIAIDSSVMDDKTVLEEHLITALNNALSKASDVRESEITKIKQSGFPYGLDF